MRYSVAMLNKQNNNSEKWAVHIQAGMQYFDTSDEAIRFAVESGRSQFYDPELKRWVQITKSTRTAEGSYIVMEKDL